MTVSKEAWEKAQQLEYQHWHSGSVKGNVETVNVTEESVAEGYREVSRKILDRLGITDQDAFISGTIIDIGAGPTARTSWLNVAIRIGIDPLYEKYQSIPWAQLSCYDRWHAQPAEVQLKMSNFADAVFCINCLDHCYDPAKVIANAGDYAKDGATFILSTDIDEPGDDMHPAAAMMTPQAITAMLTAADFIVRSFSIGRSYPKPDGTWLDGWGGATAAHWLCRRLPRI